MKENFTRCAGFKDSDEFECRREGHDMRRAISSQFENVVAPFLERHVPRKAGLYVPGEADAITACCQHAHCVKDSLTNTLCLGCQNFSSNSLLSNTRLRGLTFLYFHFFNMSFSLFQHVHNMTIDSILGEEGRGRQPQACSVCICHRNGSPTQ